MTLTPWDFALASIAAPEPESRLTSRITFAPLVIACSACCCWVDLSPWAFWMGAGTPAPLNACCRSGRSAVSQRTDDLVSGSSTATLSADLLLLPLLLLLLPPPPLSLPPQAATRNERAHSALARARRRREIGERITCSSSVDWTCVEPEASAGGRPPPSPPGVGGRCGNPEPSGGRRPGRRGGGGSGPPRRPRGGPPP